MIIYRVLSGDTPASVAEKFGIGLELLLEENGLEEDSRLAVGQELIIMYPEQTYTVAEGDSLYSIAERYGTDVNELLKNNPRLMGIPIIYPGNELVISYETDRKRDITVNGYAYPFISDGVLRTVLPYLTYLTVFTYGFRDGGELIVPDDARLINAANGYGAGSLLLISTLGDDGLFNNELSTRLFSDEEAQGTLISNLAAEVADRGYAGVEVDFEFVGKDNAEGYVAFLGKLKNALEMNGYLLFVALAPKVRADQPGLLYEGHDYGSIGAVADYVILMTYEWGYKYGPPGAVAPVRNVARVLDYAVSEIDRSKILLGVPNYGYDWKLPFIKGETAAEGITNVAAVELAAATGSEILFDGESASPYYYYTDDGGIQHVVWFENASSIEAKLDLVSEYGIAGISVWNIMKYFPQLYGVLNSEYGTEPPE